MEAWRVDLARHGVSWLAKIDEDSSFYNARTDTFEFYRNPDIFHAVLHYLNTGASFFDHIVSHFAGVLHRPHSACRQEFLDDLSFYGISPSALATCCRVQPQKKQSIAARERRKRVQNLWQTIAKRAVRQARRAAATQISFVFSFFFQLYFFVFISILLQDDA